MGDLDHLSPPAPRRTRRNSSVGGEVSSKAGFARQAFGGVSCPRFDPEVGGCWMQEGAGQVVRRGTPA
jgi:hypothetical protein